MKIALCDIETTGLNPTKHEIIEIGLIVFDSVTFEIYEEWQCFIKPFNIKGADPKALEVNGYNEEDWKDGMSIREALIQFIEKTKGCVFMAYNVSFDLKFIEFYLAEKFLKHEMSYHKIDLLSIAWAKVPHYKVFSWSLKTICTYLHILPEPKIHRALNGTLKEYEVYKALMS